MEPQKISLIKLLKKELNIPLYQRPYEWDRSNVLTLLNDIYSEYKKGIFAKKNLNLGTIILLKKDNKFDVIDGQQRIITLALLCNVLNINDGIKMLDTPIQCVSNTEIKILSNNYEIICFIDRLKKDDNFKIEEFKKYVANNINFFVIYSKDEEEAFQLFDGRNSKFKSLDPVDLLKAYHLRSIQNNDDKYIALKIWDNNINSRDLVYYKNNIQYLFDDVLFNIYNWSLNKDRKEFEKDDIYLYKGFNEKEKINYIKYYKTTNNDMFLVNKPFKKGLPFFKMVDKYIGDYKRIINRYNLYKKVLFQTKIDGYDEKNFNIGYRYINNMYYNAIFMFENRFSGSGLSEFEKNIIIDYIYKWALIHRVNNEKIRYDTINKYIIQNDNFFYKCQNALSIDELYKLNYPELGKQPIFKKDNLNLQETRSKLWKIMRK